MDIEAVLDTQGSSSLKNQPFSLFLSVFSQERVTVFDLKYEIFNLVLPLLFVLLAILDKFVFHVFVFGLSHRTFAFFVGDILFLNAIHVGFTYIWLVTSPEVREVFGLSFGGLGKFTLHLISVVLAVALLVFFSTFFRDSLCEPIILLIAAFVILLFFLGNQHSIYQFYGMARCYDECEKKKCTAMKEKSRCLIALEKSLYLVLTVCVLLISLCYTGFSLLRFLPTQKMSTVAGWVSLACVFALYFISMGRRPDVKSNKLVYLIRLFLVPLSALSFVALVGINACHGFEYLCVYKKMNRSMMRTSGKKLTKFTALFTLGVLMAFFIKYLGRPLISSRSITGALPLSYLIFRSLLFGLVYGHYYMDRKLFEMRRATTRKIVGPLLC